MRARSSPSSRSNEKYWKLKLNAKRPRPIVSARSLRIGPKLCVDRTNVPVAASKRYVKPEAGDGSGSDVSWLASAKLNCGKFHWNALLKCPECVDPSGSTALLFTTRPFGPYRSWNTSDRVVVGS